MIALRKSLSIRCISNPPQSPFKKGGYQEDFGGIHIETHNHAPLYTRTPGLSLNGKDTTFSEASPYRATQNML